ncbi:MAG TPA: hypothetical protein DCW60_02105 [Sutterella sp.]|nr:hypothetical protein [Sutterella sp.]
MSFILAFSPLLVVLGGILYFKKPAMKVAPIALVWTLFLAFTYFNVKGLTFGQNVDILDGLVWKGVKEGLKIVWMVFGAFVILNILRETEAIDDVKMAIAKISDDRRVQVIVVGLMLPIFLEGAAGADAPAAIAAPFLVALGVNPILAIALALMGDATPCSWGGAGLTTIVGGAALTTAGVSTVDLNSAMVGRIHMVGVFIIPFIMIATAYGKKGFKNAMPFLCFAGSVTAFWMFVLSNFVGAEVTSMGTGLLSILCSIVYLKVVGVNTPDEYRFRFESDKKAKYSSLRAMSPYIYMLVLLPVIRYGVPALIPNGFALMCTFGYIVWVDVVIMVCGFLGAFTLGMNFSGVCKIYGTTSKNIVPVLVTMGSLLIVAYIMQSSTTGMMQLLAHDLASVAGMLYPAAAVLIGASGSFVTGTGLGSNIMFADMHIQAAQILNANPITIFAGQNAGGSLGNLICPNNTVAACATVGQVGNEHAVMMRTMVAFGIILALYMTLAVIYTYVLFPDFGM